MTDRIPFSHWWAHNVEWRLQNWGGHTKPWYTRPLAWAGRGLYVARRYVEGARPVRGNDTEEGGCYGYFVMPDHTAVPVDLRFYGACPVQSEGTIAGRDVYYRSRGEGWQFHISKPGREALDDDSWVYEESPYLWPDGGYVPASVSEACVWRALAAWKKAGCP